jgi:hypothetical protein
MYDDDDEGGSRRAGQSSVNCENSNKARDEIADADEGRRDDESDLNENDDEIQPQNYFF